MTLHVVIGEGKINKRDLTHQLDDLKDKATTEDTNYWFLIEGKESPTQADKDLVEYLTKNEVYYATLALEGTELDELYATAEEQHTYDGEQPMSVVEAMQTLQEDDEGADLLAVLINPKDDDAGDMEAVNCIEAALDAGFDVFGLNDSMEPITLEDTPEPEPEPAPAPAKTGGAKKAAGAAKKLAAVPDPEPEAAEAGVTPTAYTRNELEGLTPAEVKALATGMGITAKTKKEQIAAILGEAAPEATAAMTTTPYQAAVTSGTVSTGTITTTANGWETVPTGKVLIAMIAPNGSVVTKMVDVAKIAAL